MAETNKNRNSRGSYCLVPFLAVVGAIMCAVLIYIVLIGLAYIVPNF